MLNLNLLNMLQGYIKTFQGFKFDLVCKSYFQGDDALTQICVNVDKVLKFYFCNENNTTYYALNFRHHQIYEKFALYLSLIKFGVLLTLNTIDIFCVFINKFCMVFLYSKDYADNINCRKSLVLFVLK